MSIPNAGTASGIAKLGTDGTVGGPVGSPLASAIGLVTQQLPASNGTDDTTRLNAALALGGRIRGLAGQTYKASAPLIIGSNTELDMTGCTVQLNANSNCNLLNNAALTAARSVEDGTIAAGSTSITFGGRQITDGVTTANSSTITSATANFTSADLYKPVRGPGIFPGIVIKTIVNSTTVTLSDNASVSATGVTLNIGTILTAADTGPVLVWGAGLDEAPLRTTMTYVSPTSATLATAASVAVTNGAVSIGARDSYITLTGGTYDSGGNVNGNALQRHLLRLSRIDHLTIQGNIRITGTLSENGLFPGDITDLTIKDVQDLPKKGQVQIAGPIYGARIDNIHGNCADDFVAFTTGNWPGIGDTAGPITGVHVTGLFPSNNATTGPSRVFRLNGGTNPSGTHYKVRDVVVDGLFGSVLGSPVLIGDDASFPATSGSDIADVTIKNLRTRSAQGAAQDLVEITSSSGANIREITLEGLVWDQGAGTSGQPAKIVTISGSGQAIGRVAIKGLHVRGASDYLAYVFVQNATVSRLEIDGVTADNAGTSSFILQVSAGGAAVTSAAIRGCVVPLGNSGAAVYTVNQGSPAPYISRITIQDCEFPGTGQAVVLVGSQGLANIACHILNVETTAAHLVSAASPMELDLNGVDYQGNFSVVDAAYAGANPVIIRGSPIRNLNATAGVSAENGGVVTCRSPMYQCDVSLLIPTADGDMAYNTNGALGCGTGPCVYNDAVGKWKNLYSGNLSAPAQITPNNVGGLVAWYKADSLGLADGTAVASWTDSSSNGIALTAAGGAQPTYKVNIQNGLSVVRFNGTSNRMIAGSAAGQIQTMFVVAKYSAATFATFAGLVSGTVADGPHSMLLGNNGGTTFFDNGLNLNYRKDEVAYAEGSMSAPMNAFNVMFITYANWSNPFTLEVGDDRSLGRWWLGDICEIIAYSGVLYTIQRKGIAAYLQAKWATPALP